MTNPYAGAIGYNRALRDAVRTCGQRDRRRSTGDERLIASGAKILAQVAGLERRQRHRHTKQELMRAAAQ